MRRRFAIMMCLPILGWLTPTVFGQYPYPYAPVPPMPMYPPTYGAPIYPPMPYYPPAPMWQPPPAAKPNVIIYGPLTPIDERPRPAANIQQGAPNTAAKKDANTDIRQVQATLPADRLPDTLPAKRDGNPVRRTNYASEGCGPACADGLACPEYGPCDPYCGEIPTPHAVRGHGRFIGEVGAYFLVPYADGRVAYSTTIGTNNSNTDFPRATYFGPRGSIGYMFHTGWGIRLNAWYLQGSVHTSIGNSDPNTTITTALAPPFQILSPSATLQQGIGADQFTFTQQMRLNVEDIECIKEWQWLGCSFLWSLGGRQARIVQDYSAVRNNPGGFNTATTVNVDREFSDSSSTFNGWGPTTSIEFLCMLGKSNLSVYTNLRGSYLWGVHTFQQNYNAQRNSVDNTGVPTFVDISNSRYASDSRAVPIGEMEAGLQYGASCFGRCYLFFRGGVVYQRWWDIGSPTSADGALSFLGGTARIGLTY